MKVLLLFLIFSLKSSECLPHQIEIPIENSIAIEDSNSIEDDSKPSETSLNHVENLKSIGGRMARFFMDTASAHSALSGNLLDLGLDSSAILTVIE